ncbi:Teichoic acid biosynthesis protein [Bibersteinia trehalosi USDA-ARS-USMARC-188]|uniref:Teichoic acid biosynthesis protein n=1 Tax=Bibersteinia trehalosi USDA-ARS-USMARC-188 TaxID=1263829 RepID=A0A4V7IBX4_BIBTR|nr:CDP-glycerol glycerophosphotransferase family protein [Bibersteinia trehalosi]AHG82487.1 Teichoic acid biosynthesis protein [Bibersteinia trehalosi USDA-ARS-USMARC-188]
MKYKVKLSLIPMLLKGLYAYKHKNYNEAERIFALLLDKQGDNAYLNFRYGMALYKSKKWDEANYYIQKAINIDPSKKSWQVQLATSERYKQNSEKVKVAEAKKAAIKDPNSPEVIWEYAISLLENKQYWMAKLQFEKYLILKPNSEKAFDNLGKVSEKLSDYPEAIKYFEKAASLSPFNSNYKYRIGYSYECLGDLENANTYYELVSSFAKSNDDVALFGIGALHAKRGLWDKALNAYKQFLAKTQSNNPELYYRIGVANERLYLWEDAGKAFEQAVKLSEIITAPWCFKCGQAYERAKNYAKAVEFYQNAVARSNNYNDYWLYRLAYSMEMMGNFEQAAKYYQQSRRRKIAHAVAPKDVIKNKEEEYLTYYTEYYETLAVNEKQVLIESFFGGNISCNPYAILLYMLDHNYDFTYIVVVKPETVIPDSLKFKQNIIFINRGSDAYLRYLCTAKYLINNVSFPYYFIRKAEQIYLNTWHGTPMKTLGKDIKSPFQDHSNVSRNFLQATHLISPNRHTTDIMLEKYDIKDLFSGEIAETGYPRIDLSFLSEERRNEIRKKLGFKNNKPVVFYAPTWRGTSQSKDFDTQKLQNDLKRLKSDKYNLVFRGHHLVESLLSEIKLDVVVAPKEIDSNELLGYCDLLITDYSSIIYDFLALNKPVISYVYDFDEYKEERGLYFEKDEMVGAVCSTISEVRQAILENLNKNKSNVLERDIEKYSYLDDGRATQRTVDFIFKNDNRYVYDYIRKDTDVFFVGPFLQNGITRSFLNLMSTIGREKNILVLINGNDLQSDNKRLEEFYRLPKDISVFSRSGRMLMTLEELWVRNKFDENFKFYSEEFKRVIEKIYKREARRLFGDSKIRNIINFEGYALFWVLLISQVNAKQHIIYQHNDKYKEWKSKFPYLEGVFRTYRYYDKIVSVSEKTMENNRNNISYEFGIAEKRFVFCNNPINIDQIISNAKDDIEIEDEFDNFAGTKFINIGRMSHEKDQLKLIEAFAEVNKKHKDTRLFILGDGPLKQELITRIKKLSLEKDVFLLGQKTNPFAYLKQADIFVLSSNHEGQPMVLLESLTLGTPIIATDIVGNRSILGDKYGLLVENSKQGLINGMNEYLENGSKQDNFDPIAYQKDAMDKFYALLNE